MLTWGQAKEMSELRYFQRTKTMTSQSEHIFLQTHCGDCHHAFWLKGTIQHLDESHIALSASNQFPMGYKVTRQNKVTRQILPEAPVALHASV